MLYVSSLILSICGYSVTTTDKPEILPILHKNINSNQMLLNSNNTDSNNQIRVKSFDWKKFQSLQQSQSTSTASLRDYFLEIPDLILLSDCFYQSDSVLPLWKVIQKVFININSLNI